MTEEQETGQTPSPPPPEGEPAPHEASPFETPTFEQIARKYSEEAAEERTEE